MPARTIAVVEDDRVIADAVAARLRGEGFEVEAANDGESAVEVCRRLRPDAVVLDLMLPGLDGLEPHAPIRLGDLEVDVAARECRLHGQQIELSPLEFDVLHHLARRPGVVFAREQLLREVWGYRDRSGPVDAIEHRPFLIAPVLDAAIREVQVRRKRGGVRVQLSVEPPSLRASGDPERIHQLVTNLLENAIRHSPGGGRVAIGAFAPDDRAVELCVIDEGPDIRAGEADRVYECIYRSDSAHSSDSGTGLGLAIARWIVDLHGGSIRAEQRRPRGCRMVVALPRTHS